MDNKISELEKSMIRLDTTLSNFAVTMSDKIGGLTSQMATMSEVLNNFAVAEEKIVQLEIDMRNLSNIQRHDVSEVYKKVDEINLRISSLHEEHTEFCTTRTADLKTHMEGRGDEKLSFGLKLAFGAMSVLWGVTTLIFWAMFNSWSGTIDSTNKIVKENQLMMKEYAGKFKLVDEKLKHIKGIR